MKYHVVYDEHGNIISAGYSGLPEPEVYDYLAPRLAPIAREDQQVAEIEVSPEEHAKFGLKGLVEQHQIDVKAPRPRLMLKSQ